MTRTLSVLAALALLCQTADAGPLRRKNQTDPRLSAASWGVGIATTVGFFALRNWQLHNKGTLNGLGVNGAAVVTTGACLALSPIVGTLMVQRELTFGKRMRSPPIALFHSSADGSSTRPLMPTLSGNLARRA